jgi:hypothetical protein
VYEFTTTNIKDAKIFTSSPYEDILQLFIFLGEILK